MSAYLYGRISRNRAMGGPAALSGDDNKLIEGLAAAVPVDIIALHALVLAATVEPKPGAEAATGSAVVIVGRSALQWSLPLLAGLAIALFLLGHVKVAEKPVLKWESLDNIRMLLPALAFVAWTLLTGTSAATPWVERWSQGYVVLVGGVLGVLVLGAATALAKPPAAVLEAKPVAS